MSTEEAEVVDAENSEVKEENMEVEEDINEEAIEAPGIDKDRLHIQNLPRFVGFKQFKKILEKNLGSIKVKKLRIIGEDAYLSCETPEDAQKAIKILNGLKVKKTTLFVKLAHTEERKYNPENADNRPTTIKTAIEICTPLANVPYEEQLQAKDEKSLKLTNNLLQQLSKAFAPQEKKAEEILRKIKPSPKIRNYRNKSEFTVGRTLEGEICVGFVGGRFSQNKHYVVPLENVDNITEHCKTIVKEFEKYVIASELPPFDEFNRVGVWKMLTVREFSGDVMLIVTIFPLEDQEQEKRLKEDFSKKFIDMSTFEEKKFRVTSIYWQSQVNCSDVVPYEHIAGSPYIYETVLDCRFRVSPSAFFQTNSQAASVLYTTIGESCGFSDSAPIIAEETKTDSEPESKKIKLEDEKENEKDANSTILLDICCGTGTISQCLIKKYGANNDIFCVGVEIVASAVEDAKQNAKANGIRNVSYIAGKAEETFRSLRYQLPSGYSLDKCNVVGVLDPPRAGMHEKVILGCREMAKMKKLIYVSCDPGAAMQNLINLCRPTSKKFYGSPFSIESIQPVDMFPQTSHFEWVVTLTR